MFTNKKSAHSWMDKEAILSQIKPMTFYEARRMKIPLHEALIEELYEAGCTSSGAFFEKVMAKEQLLMYRNTVDKPLSNNRTLLIKIFDKLKSAEQLRKINEKGNMNLSFKMLYEIIKLLQPHAKKYTEIVRDSCNFICNRCDEYLRKRKNLENSSDEDIHNDADEGSEFIARIYYLQARFLNYIDKDEDRAILFYKKSLELAKSQDWITEVYEEWGKHIILHQTVAEELTWLLMNYSLEIESPVAAIKYAKNAILTIAERGIDMNKMLFLKARLNLVKVLTENLNWELALNNIKHIKEFIPKNAEDILEHNEFRKFLCKMVFFEGLSYAGLNDLKNSESKYSECLDLTKKYNFMSLYGEVLINWGKILFIHKQYSVAQSKLEHCKEVFKNLGDYKNLKKSVYFLAKLKAEEIFPPVKKLLGMQGFTAFSTLRKWKNRKTIFWNKELNVDEIIFRSFLTNIERENQNSKKNSSLKF